MSSLAQRQRYARHLLLSEIGETGQARLCAARVRVRVTSDPRAVAVARDYLERAGLEVLDAGDAGAGLDVPVPDAQAVRVLAGGEALEEAGAALAGAFAAVEAIKAVLGVGVYAELPSALSLGPEQAS
jgi:hypothetical protein